MIKKGMSIIILIILFLPAIIGFYFLFYGLINIIDVSIYPMYATDGKYNEDIILSEKINLETGIFNDLNTIEELHQLNRKQDIYKYLYENREQFETVINKNALYIKYLNDNGFTMDYLFNYLQKISNLDIVIYYASIYLTVLIYIGIIYFIFNARIKIYFFVFFIYLILILNNITNGLFCYFTYPIINVLSLLTNKENMSIDVYIDFVNNILPIMNESVMTFFIMDTVIQNYQENKFQKNKARIRKNFYSLDIILSGLNKVTKSQNIKVRNIFFDTDYLITFTKKHKNEEEVKDLHLLLINYKKLSENISDENIIKIYIVLTKIQSNIQNSNLFKPYIE